DGRAGRIVPVWAACGLADERQAASGNGTISPTLLPRPRSFAMSADNIFADLIRRLRAGDPRAAEELVREYEPAIRLEVHCRLRDPRLRRAFDSMDVCQSVLSSFFVRAAAGQYDLEQPDQLRKLLVGMARKKLLFQVRKQRAQRRDVRRLEPITQGDCVAVAAGPSPSRQCEARDLLHSFQQRLTPEERQ